MAEKEAEARASTGGLVIGLLLGICVAVLFANYSPLLGYVAIATLPLLVAWLRYRSTYRHIVDGDGK